MIFSVLFMSQSNQTSFSVWWETIKTMSDDWSTDQGEFCLQEAIFYSVISSVLIAVMIIFSKYWTMKTKRSSIDFSFDTFIVIGLIEIPFLIHHH